MLSVVFHKLQGEMQKNDSKITTRLQKAQYPPKKWPLAFVFVLKLSIRLVSTECSNTPGTGTTPKARIIDGQIMNLNLKEY